MHLKILFPLLALCCCIAPANSDEDLQQSDGQFTGPAQLSVLLGVTGGGDSLNNFWFSDDSSQKLKAGELLKVGIGYRFPLSQSLSLQLNGAFHWDSVKADDGDVKFTRFALEALPYWRFHEDFSTGLGLSYNLKPRLDGGNIADREFEDVAGIVFSMLYHIDHRQRIDFRLASIDYQLEESNSLSVEADAITDFDGGYFGAIYHFGF